MRKEIDQTYLQEFAMKIQQIYLKIEKGMISNAEKFAIEMRITISTLMQKFLTNQKVYPMVMGHLSTFEDLMS